MSKAPNGYCPPATTVAHRLLKKTIREQIGSRPYLFVTEAAATGLGTSQVDIDHNEDYQDAGHVDARILGLGEAGGAAQA